MRTLLLVIAAVAVGVVVGRTGAGVTEASPRVACAPVRDAAVLPAVLAVAHRPIETAPVFVAAGDEVAAPEPPAEEEDDGLTEDQRWEGLVAELEDALPKDRGAIHGRVTDPTTGEPLVGVTITATHPDARTVETAITDERGYYKLELIPGRYLTTFYYLEVAIERAGVEVWPGFATPVFQKLPEARVEDPVNVIAEVGDDEGVPFVGVTSVENVYVIEGVVDERPRVRDLVVPVTIEQ